MRLYPRRYADFTSFRGFHATVWRATARQNWSTILVLVMYTVQTFFLTELAWWRIGLWCCALLVACMFGARIGRNYMLLEQKIHREAAWRTFQEDLRERMLASGHSPEEADTILWQMDLDVERAARGGESEE